MRTATRITANTGGTQRPQRLRRTQERRDKRVIKVIAECESLRSRLTLPRWNKCKGYSRYMPRRHNIPSQPLDWSHATFTAVRHFRYKPMRTTLFPLYSPILNAQNPKIRTGKYRILDKS